jgi:integrase
MPKPRKGRVYWRRGRAWGDFRDFADVGGKLEPLKTSPDSYATTDPDVAAHLATERVKQLEGRRRSRHLLGVEQQATLGEFAAHHLREKAKAGRVTDAWLGMTQDRLQAAVDYLGAGRDLLSITARDVQRWAAHLSRQPIRRGKKGLKRKDKPKPTASGKTLSPGTVRAYLNALSNLYRRAQSEACVPAGYNPVSAMMEKPIGRREEAQWLEVADAALLLESARTYTPEREDVAIPHLYPILATFLLTGGRRAEVLGLAVEDVSFDRKTITFRPHPWRRLKTSTSWRVVPLWPQLEEILRAYVFGSEGPPGKLLFPATRTKKEQPITDIRKALDAVAVRAGGKAGEITSKALRHSYCAARLQTLEGGAPVSPWTVAKEMGHGGRELVDRIYGHVSRTPHRSEAVEYRAEQHLHRKGYRERLRALQTARH